MKTVDLVGVIDLEETQPPYHMEEGLTIDLFGITVLWGVARWAYVYLQFAANDFPDDWFGMVGNQHGQQTF